MILFKDIIQIFKGLFQFKWNEESKFALFVVISMIPAALVGVLLKDQIDDFYNGNVLLVSIMLLLTGVILFYSDRATSKDGVVNSKNAFILGVVQAIAIMPGISRSGSTIASAVMLGIDREKAARFSFLMVFIFSTLIVCIVCRLPAVFANEVTKIAFKLLICKSPSQGLLLRLL